MNRKILLLVLSALFLRLAIAPFVWHPDVNNHVDWGIRFFQYGASKFYAPESNVWSYTWPNQPPGTILIFVGIKILYDIIFGFFWWLNITIPIFPSGIITFSQSNLHPFLLKLPSIVSDFGIAYLVFLLLKEIRAKKMAVFGALLFLFNPVIWYNSSVWGQTDAVINFMALLSFYLLYKKKLIWSSIVFALCLYIKISLVLFLPVWLIWMISQKYKIKKIALSCMLATLVVVFMTLPFSTTHEPISWLVVLYQKQVLTHQLQVITANAFNIWGALTGLHEQPHTLMFGLLSFQNWGYLLFITSYLPLLYFVWKKPKLETVIWVLALTAFSSWMLLTNMHERYLYPMFPYLTIVASKYRKLLSFYFGISAINLLNLYNLWWVPNIGFVKSLMTAGDMIFLRVLAGVNSVLYVLLYKIYLHKSYEK